MGFMGFGLPVGIKGIIIFCLSGFYEVNYGFNMEVLVDKSIQI